MTTFALLMGHDKLRKFAENETFGCLLQPSAEELLRDGYLALRDHPVKGHWGERFADPGAPLVLELGCGKGEYTIDLAQREPSCNYVGVDIKGARLWKGAKYATEHALGNVGFLRTRIEFIPAFFAPGEVSEIWLTFSDPQVKSENSRLSSPVFLERYSRFLAPGGKIHLKTDSQFLYQYTLAVCRANGLPVLACSEDLYAEADRFAPCLTEVQTFYEKMFRDQGYPIRYLCFALRSTLLSPCTPKGRGAFPPTPPDIALQSDGGSSAQGLPKETSASLHPSHCASLVGPSRLCETTSKSFALRGGHGRPLFPEATPVSATPPSRKFVAPEDFDSDYWRSVEGHRTLFGRDTAETRRQKLKK